MCPFPRSSTYGIFTYIWVVFGVNVGKYSIHGVSGFGNPRIFLLFLGTSEKSMGNIMNHQPGCLMMF